MTTTYTAPTEVLKSHTGPEGQDWGSGVIDLSPTSPLGVLFEVSALETITMTFANGMVETYTAVRS